MLSSCASCPISVGIVPIRSLLSKWLLSPQEEIIRSPRPAAGNHIPHTHLPLFRTNYVVVVINQSDFQFESLAVRLEVRNALEKGSAGGVLEESSGGLRRFCIRGVCLQQGSSVEGSWKTKKVKVGVEWGSNRGYRQGVYMGGSISGFLPRSGEVKGVV